MNSTDWERGLEAIAEVGRRRMNSTGWERDLEAGPEAGTAAELIIEGILIPSLAVPGVIG